MKLEFSYSGSYAKLEIFSHRGTFYLKKGDTTLAKSDDIKILRAYIDGFSLGSDTGAEKWYNKYSEMKQKLREMEIVN